MVLALSLASAATAGERSRDAGARTDEPVAFTAGGALALGGGSGQAVASIRLRTELWLLRDLALGAQVASLGGGEFVVGDSFDSWYAGPTIAIRARSRSPHYGYLGAGVGYGHYVERSFSLFSGGGRTAGEAIFVNATAAYLWHLRFVEVGPMLQLEASEMGGFGLVGITVGFAWPPQRRR